MRKRFFLLLAGLLVLFALSACGTRSKEDVVKDLDKRLGELKGYKVEAKLTLQMGKDPQTYDVEIWHKKPNFYRVNLKNSQKDQSQMILRNKEGVFVLTPALNKSFRFQSEWPENSSQAYLYESLIQDIVEDKDAKFSSTKEHYVFETKTRYQNSKMLPIQEIVLNKKDLTPVSVKVMDSDRKALVKVDFSKTEMDATFDNNDFDMAKNMTGAQLEIPVMADLENKEWAVKYPTAEIPGVELIEEKTVSTDHGKRVVLTYGGGKTFTLIQEKATIEEANVAAIPVSGDPADLGFTIGSLSPNTLTWTYQGVDYILASNDLTKEEMLMIAGSLEEQEDMVK